LTDYQIEKYPAALRRGSFIIGYLGNVIIDYFGDGKKFNAHITYYNETEPLGTAGALFQIQDDLEDSFLLINGDILFDIDFNRLIEFHNKSNSLATLVSHPNSHPYDSGILITDNDYRVINWLSKEDERLYYHNLVNAGIHVLTKELLAKTELPSLREGLGEGSADLDRDILKPALQSNRIYAYKTPEYIKDMGTPERLREVEKDITSGLVKAKSLKQSQKAIFLDRDGVINKEHGFITKPDDFDLIDGVAEAIRQINISGYLAIVVTNQPVIARGDCTLEELDLIHQKMETELGKEGAYIDALYFCPHHPDKGFPGERPEYKINCNCRKPKPGMLLQAAKDFNIDLKQSWMIGDSDRDMQAGIAAGCKTAKIGQDYQRLVEFVSCLSFTI
jgi:D,D-heptose 1,7-bisphosphate phosphatase